MNYGWKSSQKQDKSITLRSICGQLEALNGKTSKDVHFIKYYALLCSGTILMVLVAILGIADTLIAGIILGETAVSGICLALPVYSMAIFFTVFFTYVVTACHVTHSTAV